MGQFFYFWNKLRHPDVIYPRTCGVVGSRVDVVTLRDQMLRVARVSCGFFTAMAVNKEPGLFYVLLCS